MQRAFTLIELSIVLVVVGLIIGGVLVGRELISAAAVRAQISQIEKYQQAVNTFRGKYGYLPGDIREPDASRFGFTARGAYQGQGDGNGLLDGNYNNANGNNCLATQTPCAALGENVVFWRDLSTVNMVDGTFTMASPTAIATRYLGTQISNFLPKSKIGNGYVYVWSGGWQALTEVNGDGRNYFTVSAVSGFESGLVYEVPLFTVAQAYSVDKKVDDGLPQLGNVTAINSTVPWAAGGGITTYPGVPGLLYTQNLGDADSVSLGPVTNPSEIGSNMPAGTNSCFDGSDGLPEKYSVNVNGGRGMNCWISFRFQ